MLLHKIVDNDLLEDSEHVVRDPVNEKPRWHIVQDEKEHNRHAIHHQFHLAGLLAVALGTLGRLGELAIQKLAKQIYDGQGP